MRFPSIKCSTLNPSGGKLWWANEESAQLGTVTKRDGRNLAVLRNKTSGVVHMKVYDREGQRGKATHSTLHLTRVVMAPTPAQRKKGVLRTPYVLADPRTPGCVLVYIITLSDKQINEQQQTTKTIKKKAQVWLRFQYPIDSQNNLGQLWCLCGVINLCVIMYVWRLSSNTLQ